MPFFLNGGLHELDTDVQSELMSRKGGPADYGADHGRRILTWAPDDEDDGFEAEPEPEADAGPSETAEPHVKAARANGLGLSGAAPRAVRPTAATRAASAGTASDLDGESEPAQSERLKRGRPKGRAVRRQVHFHVDPQEEELLTAAVARYGSQQKGLIAALASLQEAELLHDEIARLRDECERQRRLLEDAQALFRR